MRGGNLSKTVITIVVGAMVFAPIAHAVVQTRGAEIGDNGNDGSDDISVAEPALTLSQLPTLAPKSGSYCALASTSSKRSCICPPKTSVMPTTRLVLAKNKKLPSQKWQLKTAGKGRYYLVNAKSRKALTVATPRQANGSSLVQRKIVKSTAQKWVLRGSVSACYLVSECGSDLCLTAGSKKNDTVSLKLKRFEASESQRFSLKKTSYKLTKNALLDSLDSAKGSASITGFGGASFDKKSKAGKRVSKALAAVRRSSGTCSFVMIDLETSAGISSGANQVVYGASTIKGPYVTSICKYRASRIDGSAKGHINSVASWSSNDDYKALRSRFGSSPMASFMSYSHVGEISSHDTWVSYSPKTLGKLWVGSYWANFKDSNKNSPYLRSQYKKGARSFIKGALNSRKSTTTYTKTGWGPFTRAGNIYNDAGIVVKDGHPYMIAVMSKAYYHPSQLRELVRALDAYEDYLRS